MTNNKPVLILIPGYPEAESTMPSNWMTGRCTSRVSQQHWPLLWSSQWRCGWWCLGWSWEPWCSWAPTSSSPVSETVEGKIGLEAPFPGMLDYLLWDCEMRCVSVCLQEICKASRGESVRRGQRGANQQSLRGQWWWTNWILIPHRPEGGFPQHDRQWTQSHRPRIRNTNYLIKPFRLLPISHQTTTWQNVNMCKGCVCLEIWPSLFGQYPCNTPPNCSKVSKFTVVQVVRYNESKHH